MLQVASTGYSTLLYATHNRARPHQGIKQQIPERPAGSLQEDHTRGKVIAFPILGGLYHNYHEIRMNSFSDKIVPA
jgi:hypothetical protein